MPESMSVGSPGRSALISVVIHAVTIALVLYLSTSEHSPMAKLIPVRDTAVYLPPARWHLQGDGDGRQHPRLLVPEGKPPKAAPRALLCL